MRLIYVLGLLVTCVCSSVIAQDIYKTVLADGTVVYTDSPSKNSVPVNLSSVNSAVIPALPANKPNKKLKIAKKQAAKKQYQVSILSPLNEETLRDNLGAVTIRASITPDGAAITSGKYQLIMNDKPKSKQSSAVFQLENINRGMHTIQVNFLDNSGKILASSPQQVFYLHKATALFNAN